MPDGTVRGAFDLDVGPAVRGVREYRREAARADVQTRQLGKTIDSAFGPKQVTAMRTVRQEMGGIADTARTTRVAVGQQWSGMRREIQREAAGIVSTIATVRDRMRQLDGQRARIHVDVSGIAQALAQVEALQTRLGALGSTRVSPGVGLGGGGFGTAAARAATGAAGGGGRGGRGGGAGILSLGGIGFAGIRGGTLLAAGAAALPAVQSLAGGATGLVSSAGAGALGGGAAGLGGAAPLIAGIGAVMSVAKPAGKMLQEVTKAQEKMTEAVREHGRASDQAQAAERELTRLRRLAGPGAGYASEQARGFGRDWRRQSQPARQQYYGFLGDAASIGRRAAPQLARNATIATTAFRSEGTRFTRHLAGDESQGNLATFTRSFARELPTAERSLENISLTMQRLSRASLPFFHEANVWVREQTQGWRSSTRDIEGTRRKMEPLVESAKTWAHLTGTTFRLIRSIGRESRPSGDSLVVSLDRTFSRWDEWIKANPERTQRWFSDAADSVRGMGNALAGVVGWLDRMATILRPLLDRFTQLVELTSSLGLIGAPGAIAGLVGGYRGIRGAGGTAGAAGAAGGGAGAAGAGFAAAGAAGGAAAAVAALRRQGVPPGAAAFDRRVGRLAPPIGPPRGASGTIGGARFGGPVSQLGPTGQARNPLARLGAGARGAGRAAWPIAAVLGALDFASFDGSVAQRGQAALSGATLGLISRPRTAEQRADAAARGVGSFVDRNVSGLPATVTGGRRGIGRIDAEIARLQGGPARAGAFDEAGNTLTRIGTLGQIGSRRGASGDEVKEREKRIELLRAERRELQQTNRAMERDRNRRLDERSRQRAAQYGAGIGQAYRTYRGAGLGQEAAAGQTVDQVKERLGKIRNAGVETLGEAGLAWANEMAKANPAIRKQVDELNEAIEARFRRMGRHVAIVNGDIRTGTSREWSEIASKMSSSAEEARQNVMRDFTAIQNLAVGSLEGMGFSRGEARKLVGAIERGGREGKVAGQVARGGGGIEALNQAQTGTRATPGGGRQPIRRSRGGGIVAGSGLMDTVAMGDGLVAPGEAWIANRHTLADISRATVAMYGMTAQQIIAGEHRQHSDRVGGPAPRDAGTTARAASPRAAGRNAVASGLMGANPALQPYARDAANFGLRVSSGLRPGSITSSGNTSHHSSGWALDLAGPAGSMLEYARHAARSYGSRLEELIHTPLGFGIKNGRRVAPYAQADHYDHVHLADVGGVSGALGGSGVPGVAGAGGRSIKLRGVGRKQPGALGAMRQRAGDIYAAGLERKINDKLGDSGGGGDLGGFSGGGSAEANMALGRRMLAASGMEGWGALRELWTRESNWNHLIANKSSGAYGIPQSLPGSKMASAGDDWRTNPATQIRWGLDYIKGRYGSPGAALAFHNSHNWYSRGGRMSFAGAFDRGGDFTTNGPTAFVAGEGPRHRRERVTIRPEGIGGDGVTVQIAAGAVVVQAGGGGVDDAAATAIGEKVVEKIIEAIDRGKAKGTIG